MCLSNKDNVVACFFSRDQYILIVQSIQFFSHFCFNLLDTERQMVFIWPLSRLIRDLIIRAPICGRPIVISRSVRRAIFVPFGPIWFLILHSENENSCHFFYHFSNDIRGNEDIYRISLLYIKYASDKYQFRVWGLVGLTFIAYRLGLPSSGSKVNVSVS